MEDWISNTEMSNYIGVHPHTLYRKRLTVYFAKRTHLSYEDQLNENSKKAWRSSAVDQLLYQPEHILKRRRRFIQNTLVISG